jgi:hypothetical protein
MKASLVRTLSRLARIRAVESRTHYFWWDLDETHDVVQARIRAMIASGEANEHDEFVTFRWKRSPDERLDE